MPVGHRPHGPEGRHPQEQRLAPQEPHERTPQGQEDHQGVIAALGGVSTRCTTRARLAESDLRNTQWQRDLSVSQNKIGDLRTAQGDLAGAHEAYEAGMAIAARLAESDLRNTQWQRDVFISHAKLGIVARERGKSAGARSHFEAARAIMARLVALDPRNAQWKQDLANIDAALAALPP